MRRSVALPLLGKMHPMNGTVLVLFLVRSPALRHNVTRGNCGSAGERAPECRRHAVEEDDGCAATGVQAPRRRGGGRPQGLRLPGWPGFSAGSGVQAPRSLRRMTDALPPACGRRLGEAEDGRRGFGMQARLGSGVRAPRTRGERRPRGLRRAGAAVGPAWRRRAREAGDGRTGSGVQGRAGEGPEDWVGGVEGKGGRGGRPGGWAGGLSHSGAEAEPEDGREGSGVQGAR
nr:uncharacterized protein LOC127315447 [Lolium perenne]